METEKLCTRCGHALELHDDGLSRIMAPCGWKSGDYIPGYRGTHCVCLGEVFYNWAQGEEAKT